MEKPLKRIEVLKPFSMEHHQSLLFCWKIKMGLSKNISIDRLKSYSLWFYNTQIITHFEEEDKYLFPILGDENTLVLKAKLQHQELNYLFSLKIFTTETLCLIQEKFEKHIRFEERELYKALEKIITFEQILTIKHAQIPNEVIENYNDKFWE